MDEKVRILLRNSIDVTDSVVEALLTILDDEMDIPRDRHPEIGAAHLLDGLKAKTYSDHAKLIESYFGPADDCFAFEIPKSLREKLMGLLKSVPKTTFKKLSGVTGGPLLVIPLTKPNAYDILDSNLVLFDLDLDQVITELHEVIRVLIRDTVKSPFSFVNTRAWITKPNSAEFGPNKPHVDGMFPGIMKIMVYLTPLSVDFGEFWIDGETITNKQSGFCICFKNSDILHSGRPGKLFERICIEITIQRTFIDCEQFHSGHGNGMAYLNVKTPYEFSVLR